MGLTEIGGRKKERRREERERERVQDKWRRYHKAGVYEF